MSPIVRSYRCTGCDHVWRHAGVVAMAVGAWQLHRSRPGRGSRAVLAGTGLEVAGALGDMVGHIRGGESPVAFAAIGSGFVMAATGVVLTLRGRPDGGPRELA